MVLIVISGTCLQAYYISTIWVFFLIKESFKLFVKYMSILNLSS